jgi:hypothetical protein
MLPNFFIVGAAKCGTTSLHFYLDQHPDISMSRFKEPHIYADSRSLRGPTSYAGLFEAGPRCRGESSTGYSRWPAEGDAAARIHAGIPDAKFVYLVGDPVERIIADYAQQVAVGVERLPIEQALGDLLDPANFYVCASRYGTQVRNYLKYFSPASLLVVEQWELRYERERTLREIFTFLGVEASFWSPRFTPELARRDDHVRHDGALWRVRSSPVGRMYRKLPVGPRLRVSRLVRRTARPVARPELDSELRDRLRDLLVPEVDDLRALTGRTFEHLPGLVTIETAG